MKLKVVYQPGDSEIFSLVSAGDYAITVDENRYLHPVKVRELVSGAIWDFEVLDVGTGIRLGSHYNVRHGVEGDFLLFVLVNDLAHKKAPRGDAREVAPILLSMMEKALDSYLWVDTQGNPVEGPQ
jgi:hypothetical protein